MKLMSLGRAALDEAVIRQKHGDEEGGRGRRRGTGCHSDDPARAITWQELLGNEVILAVYTRPGSRGGREAGS